MRLSERFRGWLALMTGLYVGFTFAAPVSSAGLSTSGSQFYTVDTWENDDGLPQNSIISMTQTRDGYLWMGTINGLVRFDGLKFSVFNEDNTPGLGSSPIVALFEDRHERLWIGSEQSGVLLAKDGKVTPLGIGRGNRESRLRVACEDAEGAIWLNLADGSLWRYKDGVTNDYSAGAAKTFGCSALIVDRAGQVWVGTERGILEVDSRKAASGQRDLPTARSIPGGATELLITSPRGGFWSFAAGQISRHQPDGGSEISGAYAWNPSFQVTSAVEDREGNLIVGTHGQGVFRFGVTNGNQLMATESLAKDSGLPVSYVLSMASDREGTLWVGTDGGGLNRLKARTFHVVEPTLGLAVQSVSADSAGGVWMTFNVLEWSANCAAYLRAGEFHGYGRAQGLFTGSATAVLADGQEQVWVGSHGGLFQLQENRFAAVAGVDRIPPAVRAIHRDRGGHLWLGTSGGLVRWKDPDATILTSSNGLSSDEIWAVEDGADGGLWVGTRGGGLNRMDDGRFTAFHKPDGLPSEDISSLHRDGDGVLWVGTRGTGLARWKDGKWTRYSTREGLVSNAIGYTIDDAEGYLWIGSNAGLMRVKKDSMNGFADGKTSSIFVRSFGKPDGMPTRECTIGFQPGACRTPDGRLWFPTSKGLIWVDPSRIVFNTNAPPVVIEMVAIDGRSQMADGVTTGRRASITVAPNQERLEIRYTSLNLSSPERARFRYRMVGHETDWFDAGDARVARYSKLPPGQYRFHVIACNEDGVWNEQGSEIAIVVEPPFWRTWWFLGVVFASVLGIVAGVVHFVSTQKLQRQLADLRQQEALEKERSRIARDIHDQLGANLTQVSLLGELIEGDKEEPEEVAAHARQIQSTALETSRALDQIVWTVNPSNDTLDGLVNYLCKYAQEYMAVAGLKYRLEVPADLPNAPITPEIRHNLFLAAKEAVTNIVKHAQAESAWLRLKLEPGWFTIEIQDDGKGPAGMNEKRAQSRNGLRNMGKRLEDVGGKFEIGPAPGRGTLVRLVAPLGKP